MGSLERRLERLEARAVGESGYKVPRRVECYFHILENRRRRLDGLEPLPDLPYTEEDYEGDLRTLEHTIPAMRDSAGWHTDKGRAFLDSWERNVQERIERNQP